MADQIGLHIALTRVNAVLLRSAGKRDAIAGEFNAAYNTREELVKALADCAAHFAGAEGAGWSVGLPYSSFSYRHLTFPFAGRSKVAAALEFELESALPYSAEEFESMFTITAEGKEQTQVLTCAILKERLSYWRALLAQAGIQPRYIASETAALPHFYRTYISPAQTNAPKAALVASAEDGMLHLCALTDSGFYDFNSTRLDEREVERFAASAAAVAGLEDFEARFVGGAQWAQAGSAAGNTAWKRQIDGLIDCESPDRLMIPIGLAALAADGGDDLALRGAVRRKAKWAFDWRIAAYGSAAAVVLLVGFLVFRNHMKQRTLDAINAQTAKVFNMAIPGAKPVKPVFQLEQKLAALETKMRRAGLGGTQRTDLLWMIKRLGESLPDTMPMEVDEIAYEEELVTFSGRTDRLETVERIKGTLSRTPPFRNIAVVSSGMSADGRKATFKMKVQL